MPRRPDAAAVERATRDALSLPADQRAAFVADLQKQVRRDEEAALYEAAVTERQELLRKAMRLHVSRSPMARPRDALDIAVRHLKQGCPEDGKMIDVAAARIRQTL